MNLMLKRMRLPAMNLASLTATVTGWLTLTRLERLLYLLPLAWIFDLAGYCPPDLRLAIVYLCLLAPTALWPSRRAAWAAGGVVLGLIIQAAFTLPVLAELALPLGLHLWVWHQVRGTSPLPSMGVVLYALVHVYLFFSPLGYPVAEHLSAWTGAVAGWVTGASYHLGPTYQNLGALLLFLCLSVAGWSRPAITRGRTVCYLLVALLLNGLLCLVLIRKVDFGADLVWELKYREPFGWIQLWQHLKGLAVLVFPLLSFLAYATAYLLIHPKVSESRPGGASADSVRDPSGWRHTFWRPWTRWHWLGMAGVLVWTVLCVPPTTWRRPEPVELIFIERGVVSFTKPDYTRYGRAAGGMYGLLPEYARMFGCKATIVKDVPESLDRKKVLVFTNLDEPLPQNEFDRIWEFVRQGGRLWVLGDHTFIKNGRNHINDLLAPCRISLKHDSAQFFPQGWFHSYRFRQGTPFGGLRDPAENRPAILVGASLDVKAPAVPFILGRFGYSDWGVTEEDPKRGYIGDFKYEPQERLGDLVLVAGQHVGQGKVLVFGDTTSFFCNNMPRSFELLRAVLSWLGDDSHAALGHGWTLRWLVGVGLIGLGAGLLAQRHNLMPGAVCLVLGGFGWLAHSGGGWLPWDSAFTRQRMAIVDYSHQPYASKHGSMPTGLHGLSVNLMRHGLLPVALNEWDADILDAAKMIVISGPRREINRSERKQLGAFLTDGGVMLVACGFPQEPFCRKFLADYRIRITDLPLGRFFDRLAFAQPVSFFSAWPLEIRHPDASVLCFYDDWPLMALIPVEKGRLVVIGDSEFLLNANLEGFESYDPNNIRFFRALLDYTVGASGS